MRQHPAKYFTNHRTNHIPITYQSCTYKTLRTLREAPEKLICQNSSSRFFGASCTTMVSSTRAILDIEQRNYGEVLIERFLGTLSSLWLETLTRRYLLHVGAGLWTKNVQTTILRTYGVVLVPPTAVRFSAGLWYDTCAQGLFRITSLSTYHDAKWRQHRIGQQHERTRVPKRCPPPRGSASP